MPALSCDEEGRCIVGEPHAATITKNAPVQESERTGGCASAVEVRYSMHAIVLSSDFNPAHHHIPQWAAAELRNVA